MSELKEGVVVYEEETGESVRVEYNPETQEAQFYQQKPITEEEYLKAQGYDPDDHQAGLQQRENFRQGEMLQNELSEIRQLLETERREHKEQLDGLRQEHREQIAALRQEHSEQIESLREEIRRLGSLVAGSSEEAPQPKKSEPEPVVEETVFAEEDRVIEQDPEKPQTVVERTKLYINDNGQPEQAAAVEIEEEKVVTRPGEGLSWREKLDNFIRGRSLRNRIVYYQENGFWARRDEVEERDNRVAAALIAIGGIALAAWLISKGFNGDPDAHRDIDIDINRDGMDDRLEVIIEDADGDGTPDIIENQQTILENQETILDRQNEIINNDDWGLKAVDNELEKIIRSGGVGNLAEHGGMAGTHLESLEFRGNVIWDDVARNLRQELGYYPSNAQIYHATDHVLRLNNLSWEGARHLPVGYTYRMPNNVLSVTR